MIVRKMSPELATLYAEKHFYKFSTWRQVKIRLMLIRGRERTGVKDRNGLPIFTGDILETNQNETYPEVRELVVWDEKKAAFVYWCELESGGGASSPNMEGSGKLVIVGNIYKNPEMLTRAKRVKE